MTKHLHYLKYINSLEFKYNLNLLKPLKIGCDNVSINAPIHALSLINIPFVYVFHGDNNKTNIKSILANYSPQIIYDNITNRNTIDIPVIDVYIASIIYQKCILENIESSVFYTNFITIKKTNPKFFILEYKKKINMTTNPTFKIIINKLQELTRYNIYFKSLNTQNYGIPQFRNRIYIIGIDKKLDKGFIFPKDIKQDINVYDIVDTSDTIDHNLTLHQQDLLNDLQTNNLIYDLHKNWSININVSNYKKCNPILDICPCLSNGRRLYLSSIKRHYTTREYLKLQGFKEFIQVVSDSRFYKQISDSMSVNVVAFLFKSIISTTTL